MTEPTPQDYRKFLIVQAISIFSRQAPDAARDFLNIERYVKNPDKKYVDRSVDTWKHDDPNGEFRALVTDLDMVLDSCVYYAASGPGSIWFADTVSGWMTAYLSAFVTRQRDKDLYKVSYAVGEAIKSFAELEHCRRLVRTEAKRMAGLLRIWQIAVLNDLLETETECGLARDMHLKLNKTAFDGTHLEQLGVFGVYKIFRNCAKYCARMHPDGLAKPN